MNLFKFKQIYFAVAMLLLPGPKLKVKNRSLDQ